jgi:LacI family transcriptional regulator
MKRITIKDIARLLGINVSTVSRALSNHPDVNAETRVRVQEVAESMGYIPNTLAVNLRRKHSGLIALLISEINMFFVPSVIRAIEEEMRRNGYQLIILQSKDMVEQEIENLRICRQLAVEGILVSLAANTLTNDHFAPLLEDGIPIVFFDKVPSGPFNTVSINDEKIARQAVKHLIEHGHRRILGIFGLRSMRITQERYAGYQKSLREAGITTNPDWEIFADGSKQANALLVEYLKPYLSCRMNYWWPPHRLSSHVAI